MERYPNNNFYCVNCQKSYPITAENYHKLNCKIIKICPFCSMQIIIDDYYEHILNHELEKNNENNQNEINNNNINQNNNDNNINQNNNDNNKSIKDIIFSKLNFFNIFKNEKEELNKEEINKIENKEEREAYEKKILGIKNKNFSLKDFLKDNKKEIFEVTIDLIGCVFFVPQCYADLSIKIADSIYKRNEIKYDNDKISSEDILNYLPITILGKRINNNIEYKCIICYDDFNEGDKITTLPCVHVFHIECIQTWILQHKYCPICKFNITKSSLIGEIK